MVGDGHGEGGEGGEGEGEEGMERSSSVALIKAVGFVGSDMNRQRRMWLTASSTSERKREKI